MSVSGVTLAGFQIEGNLLAADMTAELLIGNVKGQAPEDFGLGKSDKLADEIAIAWGDAKAYWAAFQRALTRTSTDEPATTITRDQWAIPLLKSLGYNPVYTAKAEIVEGQTYAISHRAESGENKPPIHIIGCRLEIDKRPPSGTPRLSAHALVQEYLNKTEHLWAIATNGYRWRLLRDSSLMTRLTYIEFDLEQILNGENFAEFCLFYRLFHRSRLPQDVDNTGKCLLEYYHQETLQQGGRVRDILRDGVENALKQLGTGFLQHQNNEHLREKVRSSASAPYLDEDALKRNYEQALLRLKIVDPACGSGHFLLAAARRLGKELAKIRTGEAEPGYQPLRQAIRDVIQNCIYGVDINPLAVDLCKVALWIEGFASGMPLNFLDHRIKCGNSLVGVLDIGCLDEGIPDEAYKAVTGDDKKLSTQFKKRNQKERDNQGQLSLFENLEGDRTQYTESARELGEIAETTPQQVKQKQAQYQQSRKNPGWWRDYSACNLWTSAFFMPLTEHNLQLFPTTAALSSLVRSCASAHPGNYEQKIVDAANKLAEEKHFFHWCVEFPEVFEEGGFDCVLGNPPWELLQIAEKEFFASRSAEIANAANKAAREKLIKELPHKNLELAQAFEDAKHDAEAQNKFIRESGRFVLTAVGKINTYAVFAETTRNLISPDGRVGVIVPTGIATDDTCQRFFGDLTQKQNLSSLYDFENREGLFVGIDRQIKFSLLAITNKPIKQSSFAFFLTQPRQLDNQARLFQLSPEDIALLNPNTLTCPVFRTSADAELTKKIYQRVPVLENEGTGTNPWGISFMQGLFNMATDSGLFKNEAGNGLVPLYEAKMFHQFTHRWATYTDSGDTRDLTDVEKGDTFFAVQPRYWVSRVEVENKLADKWKKSWLLAFRSISKAVNERTAIFSFLPKLAVGHKAPIIFIEIKEVKLISCFLANSNSLVFDFVTKQKIGGTDFSFFILKQLPILPPESYTPEDIEFISTRVLELVYTAWDMQPFAKDMGCDREPFIWNSNRRALLRAELDAYYAKLYGLTRDELRYILDPADVYGEDFPSETFRVLKNNEIKQFGEYRTRRLVLEAWDKMFGKS